MEIGVEEKASQVERTAWAKVWRCASEKHTEGRAEDVTVNKMDWVPACTELTVSHLLSISSVLRTLHCYQTIWKPVGVSPFYSQRYERSER